MKPVFQTRFGANRGNCFQASLASIFELPLEEVPDFCNYKAQEDGSVASGQYRSGHWCDNLGKWLAEKFQAGFLFLLNEFVSQNDTWIQICKGLVCVAGGKNHEGISHSVVWEFGRGMIHDPHEGGGGLVGSPEDFLIFFPLDPLKILEAEKLRNLWIREADKIEQLLGKALHYPELYPHASTVDDGTVCVGEHVSETIAAEAAKKIEELEHEVEQLEQLVGDLRARRR